MAGLLALVAPPTWPFWARVGAGIAQVVRGLMTQAPAAGAAAGTIGIATFPGSTPIQQAQTGAQARDQAGTDTCTTQECKRRNEHWHHEMPQQFRDRFAKAGIDIDSPANGRVIPGGEHLSMHGQGYNQEWQEFFRTNPDAGPFTILQKRDMMVQEYGLDGYRRPSGRYPQL